MKKLIIVGLIVILIVGLVSVFAIGTQNKAWHGWKKGGTFDKSAWLEKVGLPADATEAQIIEFKKGLWHDHKTNIKEKLGLSDDASEEEVKEAMQGWKKNKFHKGHGFGKGSLCGKS